MKKKFNKRKEKKVSRGKKNKIRKILKYFLKNILR
jgi:hypothetical protein